MKKLIKNIIFSKTAAKRLIKPLLRCHGLCYKLAGRYGMILNDGVHPKHHILKYKEWFLENIEPGWTIMDIGCNTGMLPFVLSKKAGLVYGIEINQEHVAIAKTQHVRPNIEYICADATTHNYDSCRLIDCVTMSNVLEHIEYRVDFLKKIVHRVKWADENCKRFLFRTPVIDREWIVLYKKELGLDYRLDPTHYIEYTLEQFKEELGQANIVLKKLDIRFGEIYAVCRVVCA